MNIAILTSGILPVPAVKGGAVENLIDFYLEYNEQHELHDITVYSIAHPSTKNHPALKSKANHYHYIEVQSRWAKINKIFYHWTHHDEYYHYTIEYLLHQAIKHIKKQNYDIIILENRPGYAIKLQGKTQAKLVYHLHNDLLNNTTKKCLDIYKLADKVITVSDYITSQVKTINSEDHKCTTVYNGINISAFVNQQTDIGRDVIGIKPNVFLIAFSGRLIPEKGILELVTAMQRLKEYPDIKLMVLGSADLGSRNAQTKFFKKLQETTKGQNNIVFTGYVPYSQMGDYLHLADIAVIPSMWEEPFGLTCIEAMAAGLPLITTRSGGIPEISEGVATIVDREDIVNHLVTAILDLYQHPEKRKQMSAASIERSKLFDKETYAKNFFAALEHIR